MKSVSNAIGLGVFECQGGDNQVGNGAGRELEEKGILDCLAGVEDI